MPQKNSTKKAPLVKSDTSSSSITPPKAPKKAVSEIDEIFSNGRKRKLVKEAEVKEADKMMKKKKKIKRKKENGKSRVEENGDGGVVSESRRKTGDGLKVYTEEELGFGNENSGGTKLCPFDCDCCF